MGESLQEWARSLVGRDWEIYWKPIEEPSSEEQQQENGGLTDCVPQQKNDDNHEDDDEDEDMEDVEDWYDAHIEDVDGQLDNGNYSFHVSFVGDETIYKMVLEPSWVRPAARAWIKRSKAILSCQSTLEEHPSIAEWEQSLPVDTSTLDDRGPLAQIKAQHVECTPASTSDDYLEGLQPSKAQNLPSEAEVAQIRRLSYLLSSQIYLRSRLAPIVEHDGEAGGLSEVYVEHLLQCLKYLDTACRWYLRCWDLHRIIFYTPIPSSDEPLKQSAYLDEEYPIKEGLQEGRRVVIQLLKVDTSVAGAKRRKLPDISPGARKTKRRRKNKSFQDYIKESERAGEQPSPEEDEFLSTDVVDDFVKQLRTHDNRWYLGSFGKMLLSLSFNIVAPSLLWKHRVESLLGDRPSSDVDDSHSDGATSEEDNDDDVEKVDDVAVPEQPVASSTEGKRYYTYDEISSFEVTANYDQVLRQLNLSRWQDRLRQKLSEMKLFETRAWGLLSQLFSQPSMSGDTKQSDEIYSELLRLRADAIAPNSPVANVNPLGCSTSVLHRKVLDDSIAIRSWYLDLHRVETSKERLVFIERMAARASELPRIPSCEHTATHEALFDKAVERLKTISQRYFDHLSRFNKYRSRLLSRSNAHNDEGLDFLTIGGVSRALQELKDIRVLSLAEEMLSVRLDVLSWKIEAQNLLANKQVPFNELLAIQKSLDLILRGRSATRTKMLASIESNDNVDAEIRSFAEADIATLCGSLTSLINSKYSATTAWKDRADSIISSLEQHSGQQHSTQKPSPMIDLKRINGLLAEYNSLSIFLPEHYTFLVRECTKANLWSLELTNTLADRKKALTELVSYLQTSKTNRPRGIIVNPPRHVVDNLVDLLLWHEQVRGARRLSSQKVIAQNEIGVDDLNGEKPASLDPKSLYPLISEGSEVLELFSKRNQSNNFSVSSAGALALVAKQLDSRRPMRVLSRAKLEANPLGSLILDRLICEDELHGSPLSFLLFLLWRMTAIDFFGRYESRRGTKSGMSLKEAQTLLLQKPVSQQPSGRSGPPETDGVGSMEAWGLRPSNEEKQLLQLVQNGESKEKEAVKALATAKELFRGPSCHMEAIREHIIKVKELFNEFRVLRNEGNGLVLSQKLEYQLDLNLKALSWVVRTFPYPFLHQVHCELSPENRISWNDLISLNERKPAGLENMGDCAGIAVRAAELYESARAWQQEISKVTMLSNRGGKRRGECTLAESDGGTLATVDVEKVHRLVKDPVLLKVDMPREDAVTEILERAKAFERHMHRFLGEDYDGINPDRAPYPEARSLIGSSGEFLLYRLTGSPLFASLISSIELIATTARGVLADTPGKAAFEWIRRAVSWIDSLRAAVTRNSDIERLVITENDAREILDIGKSFFLDIPEDLRRTLSTHMIYVSTSKVDEKLTVVFKKGGAHHSIGGTAIRWCPVLFDSLREDISKLDEWRSQVQTIQRDFETFLDERDGEIGHGEESLSHLHDFLEEASMLLEEGVEALVVAPPREDIDALSDFRATVEKYLRECSDSAVIEGIRKKRFEDSIAALKDRFALLDSLLSRYTLENENGESDPPTLQSLGITDGSFRDTCRLYLEKALRKGIQLMGLQQDNPDLSDIAFCAIRAWEIELEMFNRFQVSYGEKVICPEYRDKARILRWGLEDSNCPRLCIQVLLGEIEPSDLVIMSEEQLIGSTSDKNNSRDIDEIERQAYLAVNSPPVEEDVKEVTSEAGSTVSEMQVDSPETSDMTAENKLVKPGPPVPEATGIELTSSKPIAQEVVALHECPAPKPVESEPKEEGQRSDFLSNDPTAHANEDNSESFYEDLDLPAAPAKPKPGSKADKPESPPQKESASSYRPDAPPSLAASLGKRDASGSQSSSSKKKKTGKASKKGKYVTNSSGDNGFLFTVCKPTVKFTARFYLENEAQASLCGILPESIIEKGRLRVDEFSKFLAGKLKGGRWVAIPMRMSIYSEEDAKKHKKFYKEYETMKRIAMFSIGENTKVFLVTPKFHKVAAKAMSSSLSVETSTYAVVLTREKLSHTR